MSLKQVFKKRIDCATHVLERAEAGPKKIKFSSTDLSNPAALLKLHNQFPRKKPGTFYLYQLSFDGKQMSVISQARTAFRSVRAAGQLNMSRNNKNHPDSNSIYVGTSESMHDRFRTHLGMGKGTTTWALYLSAWAIPLTAKFIVEYYEFKETIAEDVELIEGVLWDSLQPLFGKKGGK
jgi:hypothetical protein